MKMISWFFKDVNISGGFEATYQNKVNECLLSLYNKPSPTPSTKETSRSSKII